MSTPTWSPQQAQALRMVQEWLTDPTRQLFYLAGWAGTGKTTLVKHFIEGVQGTVLSAAYTGKAASVMRTYGMPNACTLHSLIYKPTEGNKDKLYNLMAELKRLPPDAAPETRHELEAEIRFERREAAKPRFLRNEDSPIKDCTLLVADEVSMVNQYLGDDLMSFGKKVLVLGDPFQLPPVKGTGYFTSRKPDMLLTEIHRQAADNPIIHYSKIVREGGVIPFGDLGKAKKIKKSTIDNKWLATNAGQILTGKNATRRAMNKIIRKHLGYRGIYPMAGERLVMLKNDRDLGVLNGVLCNALEDAFQDPETPENVLLSIDYEGMVIGALDCMAENFLATHENREPNEDASWDARRAYPVDFGYCLTVHKSQGSQWDRVTLADDGFNKREPAMRQRWLYTAITRAREELVILT
jgi:exodeoxyribonuclease-5